MVPVSAPAASRAALGYVHPGQVEAGFMYSVIRAFAHEAGTHGSPFLLIAEACASGALPDSRNNVVAHFLDHTDAEWLWCVDADMGFGADCLSRLIDAADPVERPVVGALCFGQRKADEDVELAAYELLCFPTLYAWEEHDDRAGFRVITDYPADTLLEVSATGAACFVVHRDVLGKIRAEYGDRWFDRVDHPKGARFSEDLSFFVRVAGVDAPTHVHTGIPTSHSKGGVFLREREFLRQQALQDASR
jgi:hypothetical protein